MKFLLVNPWIYDFKAYDLWLKPLGLLYIAGILRQQGHEVEFIDCLDRHHPLLYDYPKPVNKNYGCGKFISQVIPKPELYRKIPRKYKRYGLPWELWEKALSQANKPDYILVTSMMTYWYPGVFAAISSLKARFPEVPIILGGIYSTLCHEHALKNSGADYVCEGNDLKFLWELLGINPLAFKDFPYPAYELYSHLDYIAILTSWGCPFRCKYCASFKISPEFTQRESQVVVDEIINFAGKYKIKDFAFYDDALFVNPERHIKPILRALCASGLNFHTPNALHPKYIDEELAGLMFKAGFKTIRLGLETLNPDHQNNYSAYKVTTAELREAIARLKAAGFTSEQIGVYLLAGLPGQSYEELKSAILWVKEEKVKSRLNSWSPLPGTPLGDTALENLGLQDEPLANNNGYFIYCNSALSYPHFQELINLERVFKV